LSLTSYRASILKSELLLLFVLISAALSTSPPIAEIWMSSIW
jgi:hypothetical protein